MTWKSAIGWCLYYCSGAAIMLRLYDMKGLDSWDGIKVSMNKIFKKWSRRGSNPRPSAHKTNALTNWATGPYICWFCLFILYNILYYSNILFYPSIFNFYFILRNRCLPNSIKCLCVFLFTGIKVYDPKSNLYIFKSMDFYQE